MDRDELVRFYDRQIKIRTLQFFEGEELTPQDLEREFALAAIQLMRRQPVMADLAGVGDVIAAPEGDERNADETCN